MICMWDFYFIFKSPKSILKKDFVRQREVEVGFLRAWQCEMYLKTNCQICPIWWKITFHFPAITKFDIREFFYYYLNLHFKYFKIVYITLGTIYYLFKKKLTNLIKKLRLWPPKLKITCRFYKRYDKSVTFHSILSNDLRNQPAFSFLAINI